MENPHNSSQAADDTPVDSPTVAPPLAAPLAEVEAHSGAEQAPASPAPADEARFASPAPAAAEPSAPNVPAAVEEAMAVEPPEPMAEEEEEVEPRGPIEETPVAEEPVKMDWYILKVQSNREESIRESLQRRVKVAGLERYFGEIIVPTEMVSEFKGGKKRVVKRKLYPGYLVAHMEINDETWFLVRETPGIGDFTGSAGKPTPMQPHEVAKIVAKQEEKAAEAPKLKINFNVGDRVKINEGTFENFEGEVDSIDEASGRVTVMINIFGRSTPVELEYWQIEAI
jgi:transcriptional antiterminator NusG